MSATVKDDNMTYAQGLRLTTRAISVYLVCWALSDLIAIPREVIETVLSYRLLHAASYTANSLESQHIYLQSSVQF